MTALFDDLMDTTPKTDETQPETTTDEATTPATEETVEEARETLTVDSLTALPEGYVDVKGFAWLLTQRNLTNAQSEGRMPGPDDMVDTQAVYAATRGKRWSLPSVDAVAGDGTKLGVVIPTDAGLQAWDARPERGTGGGAGMTPERKATRILRAGKAKAQLAYWQKRYDRYTTTLAEVGATWADADAAYEAWQESEEGKKAIADDNKKDNGEGDE